MSTSKVVLHTASLTHFDVVRAPHPRQHSRGRLEELDGDHWPAKPKMSCQPFTENVCRPRPSRHISANVGSSDIFLGTQASLCLAFFSCFGFILARCTLYLSFVTYPWITLSLALGPSHAKSRGSACSSAARAVGPDFGSGEPL